MHEESVFICLFMTRVNKKHATKVNVQILHWLSSCYFSALVNKKGNFVMTSHESILLYMIYFCEYINRETVLLLTQFVLLNCVHA